MNVSTPKTDKWKEKTVADLASMIADARAELNGIPHKRSDLHKKRRELAALAGETTEPDKLKPIAEQGVKLERALESLNKQATALRAIIRDMGRAKYDKLVESEEQPMIDEMEKNKSEREAAAKG